MQTPDRDNDIRRLNPGPFSTPNPLPDGKEKIPLGSGIITRLLGQGGMAAVYEIWNQELEMYRAVKLINPGSEDVVRQRFQTEIKISAKLKHPNIVEIHGVGEWHGLPFIEMEKVEGTALDEIIKARGALPAAACTSIGIMICRALNYAHNQQCTIYGRSYLGVIHRDLKPGNIMISKKGEAKLMDFGIARPMDVSFKTLDGLVSGTLPYLAPEQIEKKKLDVRTDLYALGVTMYEIVTGAVAFPQASFAQLVACKTKSKYRRLEEFSIVLPSRLRSAIYKCMNQDPQKRFATTGVLLKELEKIHKSLTNKSPDQILASIMAAPVGKKLVVSTRRRIPWAGAAAVFCVACAGIVAYHFEMPAFREFAKRHDFGPDAKKTAMPVSAEAPLPSKPAATPGVSSVPVVSKEKKSLGPKSSGTKTAETEKPAGFLEMLKAKYGTDDPESIMSKELSERNFSVVLKIYASLPPGQTKSDHALILKMHAIEGVGAQSLMSDFFQNTFVKDGEFTLAKAKFLFTKKDIDNCEKLLTQSLKLPHAFIEYETLKREVYYYMALCATARFDQNPSDQTYKTALDSWWQLRTLLRSDPENEYNVRANQELQRMGKKMQKG